MRGLSQGKVVTEDYEDETSAHVHHTRSQSMRGTKVNASADTNTVSI